MTESNDSKLPIDEFLERVIVFVEKEFPKTYTREEILAMGKRTFSPQIAFGDNCLNKFTVNWRVYSFLSNLTILISQRLGGLRNLIRVAEKITPELENFLGKDLFDAAAAAARDGSYNAWYFSERYLMAKNGKVPIPVMRSPHSYLNLG